MIRFFAAAALLFATPALAQTASAPATKAAPAAAPLVCTAGTAPKTYGGSAWNVHACNDGHSVAIEAAQGNKAVPCTFTMQYQSDGSYEAHGRCSGDKTVTQAAFNDIGNLNATQVQSLYDAAQANAQGLH